MSELTLVEHTKAPARRRVTVFGRHFYLPQSRGLRIAIGIAFCIMGVFGFLPVLGFWMIPLGVLILSYEFASVRRFRRRGVVWWERRRRTRAAKAQSDKT